MPKKDNSAQPFLKDCIKVPDKILKEKLAKFGLKPSDLVPLRPFYNISDYPAEIKITPTGKEHHYIGDLGKYIRQLKPDSLSQLKEWVGIPNRVFEKMSKFDLERHRGSIEPRKVDMHKLPRDKKFDFNNLNNEQKSAVKDCAYNLIYGYANNEFISRSPIAEIADFVLTRASSGLNLFFAEDLIVGPNDHVVFENFGTLYFNNVIVYGSGSITIGNQTKLHAHQIAHY